MRKGLGQGVTESVNLQIVGVVVFSCLGAKGRMRWGLRRGVQLLTFTPILATASDFWAIYDKSGVQGKSPSGGVGQSRQMLKTN